MKTSMEEIRAWYKANYGDLEKSVIEDGYDVCNVIWLFITKKYHITYTLDGKTKSRVRRFESVDAAERWLESIGATNWGIFQ